MAAADACVCACTGAGWVAAIHAAQAASAAAGVATAAGHYPAAKQSWRRQRLRRRLLLLLLCHGDRPPLQQDHIIHRQAKLPSHSKHHCHRTRRAYRWLPMLRATAAAAASAVDQPPCSIRAAVCRQVVRWQEHMQHLRGWERVGKAGSTAGGAGSVMDKEGGRGRGRGETQWKNGESASGGG